MKRISSKQLIACAADALALLLAPESLLAADTPALKKVRIGSGAATCDAPLFVAYEKNFFKEEVSTQNLSAPTGASRKRKGIWLSEKSTRRKVCHDLPQTYCA